MPVYIPIQNITFPNVSLSLKNRVLESRTNGSCSICIHLQNMSLVFLYRESGQWQRTVNIPAAFWRCTTSPEHRLVQYKQVPSEFSRHTSSCTHAERKKVISVAVDFDTWYAEMLEWYTCRRRKLWTGLFQSRANWSQVYRGLANDPWG